MTIKEATIKLKTNYNTQAVKCNLIVDSLKHSNVLFNNTFDKMAH